MTSALSRAMVMGRGLDPVHYAKLRVLRHLGRHPEGVSKEQMYAWVASVRKHGGLGSIPFDRIRNYEKALGELVLDGRAACTNGVWWLRRRKNGNS